MEHDTGNSELVPWYHSFTISSSRLNILLFAAPVAIYAAFIAHDATLSFIASMIAIMPLAFLMGKATEEIALRTSESIGGLLNATFGNAAEMIIALLAIIAAMQAGSGTETEATMIKVVQASLIGSILGNLLLVMGLSFLWGGLRFQEQEFNRVQVGSNSSLLLLAVIALIIPTVFHAAATNSSDDSVLQLSRIVSLILLLIYGLFLLFQLKTHASLFATDGAHHESPSMAKRDAAILLVVATILVSFMAEILVHSLEDAAEELQIPHLFIGIILLPLFGNAAEHFTAVTVAGKNKMDLSFAISVGSSTQIAVFIAPLIVLVSWAIGVPLTFEFGLLETTSAFLAVLIANMVAVDGKSNWLEGAMLLATYAVLAVAFLMYG